MPPASSSVWASRGLLCPFILPENITCHSDDSVRSVDIWCLALSELTTFCAGGHLRFVAVADGSCVVSQQEVAERFPAPPVGEAVCTALRAGSLHVSSEGPSSMARGCKDKKIEEWALCALWEGGDKTTGMQVKLLSPRQEGNSRLERRDVLAEPSPVMSPAG